MLGRGGFDTGVRMAWGRVRVGGVGRIRESSEGRVGREASAGGHAVLWTAPQCRVGR